MVATGCRACLVAGRRQAAVANSTSDKMPFPGRNQRSQLERRAAVAPVVLSSMFPNQQREMRPRQSVALQIALQHLRAVYT